MEGSTREVHVSAVHARGGRQRPEVQPRVCGVKLGMSARRISDTVSRKCRINSGGRSAIAGEGSWGRIAGGETDRALPGLTWAHAWISALYVIRFGSTLACCMLLTQ